MSIFCAFKPTYPLIWSLGIRAISTTPTLSGRRATIKVKWLKMAEHPYDSRFPLSPKDIGKSRHSGKITKLLQEMGSTGHMMPQRPGYTDKHGTFHVVPEMIPEFVVPDLENCKMKPYVSYKVPDIKQAEFTAKDLFNATYAKDIVEKYQRGKLDVDSLTTENILNKKLKS